MTATPSCAITAITSLHSHHLLASTSHVITASEHISQSFSRKVAKLSYVWLLAEIIRQQVRMPLKIWLLHTLGGRCRRQQARTRLEREGTAAQLYVRQATLAKGALCGTVSQPPLLAAQHHLLQPQAAQEDAHRQGMRVHTLAGVAFLKAVGVGGAREAVLGLALRLGRGGRGDTLGNRASTGQALKVCGRLLLLLLLLLPLLPPPLLPLLLLLVAVCGSSPHHRMTPPPCSPTATSTRGSN